MPDKGHLWIGFLIGAGADIVLIPVAAMLFPLALFAWGLVQLLRILPLFFTFRAKGTTNTANGLWIAAGICFLLNAACWSLIRLPMH